MSPARAAPFVGDWSAPVTSPMGPATYVVSVKIDNGNVVATVNGGMGPPAKVSDISLVGQNLFLKYVSELPGMSIPGLVAMTPQGPNMLLTISMMDGQFEMVGTATKGGAAAGRKPRRGRGGGAGGSGRWPRACGATAGRSRHRPHADDVGAPRERPGGAEAATHGARAREGGGASSTARFRSRPARSKRSARRPAPGRRSSPTMPPTSTSRTCSATTRSSWPARPECSSTIRPIRR